MNAPYPWHATQWQTLQRLAAGQRLGHALLLSGRPGTGTDSLAEAFARERLCETDTGEAPERPCGTCRSCLLLAADSHPDLKRVGPLEEGKAIVIDQIRELTDYYALKPHYNRGKVTLIHPADRMNRAAANALLKVLEEPPPGALLILVCDRFSALPMTIRSRCVRIPCEHVDPQYARTWLQAQLETAEEGEIDALLTECGGAPLAALALAGAPDRDLEQRLLTTIEALATGKTHALSAAQGFRGLTSERLLQLFLGAAGKLIFAKFASASYYQRATTGPDPGLQAIADHLNLKHLYAFVDLLFETKTLLSRHAGLREADIVDSLWLGLGQMTRQSAAEES